MTLTKWRIYIIPICSDNIGYSGSAISVGEKPEPYLNFITN